MSGSVFINDVDSIRELKTIKNKERELFLNVLSKEHGSNSADEILACLSCQNLLLISSEHHLESDSSIGYKLGVNSAETLSTLYLSVIPVKLFLIKESEKPTMQLGDTSEEVKKTLLLVNDIIEEISKLLLCEEFLHTIDVTHGSDNGEVFTKKLYLKRYSSAIPNPHSIPSAYKSLLHDQKEVYRVYSNFANYFACNWNIAIKRLSKIRKSLNEIHNLCPLIRLHIVKAILHEIPLSHLPSDILTSLVSVNPKSILHFHPAYILSLISNVQNRDISIESIAIEMKKVAEILSNPMKDVIHFNIVMESTIKSMIMMRELQAGNALPSEQHKILQKVELFFNEVCKRYNINIQEILTMSHKISAPFISKNNIIEQHKTSNNGITM